MDETHSAVSHPALKLLSVWAAIGITSWADAAAAIAFLYTVLLVSEWLWKRMVLPLINRYKKSKEVQREAVDSDFDPSAGGSDFPGS